MKTFRLLFLLSLAIGLSEVGDAQTQQLNLSNQEVRTTYVQQLAQQSVAEKEVAWSIAKSQGWTPRVQLDNALYELVAIRDGKVYMFTTNNVDAAISTATDLVRDTTPYDVSGIGQTVGIWDGGSVLSTHQEFNGRVTVMDGSASHWHSTHVGGTVGATGVDPAALGMAPDVDIDSYDWNNDQAEMVSRAMSSPGESDKIQVSNHSYGFTSGWDYGTVPPRWYGTWGNLESDNFGIYSAYTVEWDTICYNAPYYLPFKSAGNDRDDLHPNQGAQFAYYDGGWQTKNFDIATDPRDDGWDNGGFDTIPHRGAAKNVMTVGAVDDAVLNGIRHLPFATMAVFSGWGPTDDGRIKPDIMGNGIFVYSTDDDNDTDYTDLGGTSMSTPNVSGSAILLIEYYESLFSGQAMRASTLKGLVIHTADDLGNTGPDYSFGWGLMNTEAAATHIKEQYDNSDADFIVEGLLNGTNPTDNYTINSDGCMPIRVTLCWTDPPGSESTTLNDSTPKLVNDLDIRVTSPGGGTTYQPYILDPTNPSVTATNGDNTLDNVEQIYISVPAGEGDYTVEVSHKSTLVNNEQHYSLILGEVPESVFLDIKPQSCPNPLNLKSKGVLPVAILGTENFDVTDIEVLCVKLAGVSPIRSSFEDVTTPLANRQEECECNEEGPDGFVDLTLKFKTQEIVNALGEVSDGQMLPLTITGVLREEAGGTAIRGLDCVRILKKGKQDRIPPGLKKADLNSDGVVDQIDMCLLTEYWLKSYELD